MRIESQFKDYYDHIQTSGIDQSVVFKRESIVKLISQKHPFIKLLTHNLRPLTQDFYPINEKSTYAFLRFNPFVVGYCGQLIRGFQFSQIEYDDTSHSQYFYGAEAVFTYLTEQKDYVIEKRFLSELEKWVPENEMQLITPAGFSGNPHNMTANFFREMWCPIFLYGLNSSGRQAYHEKRSHVIINPNLKKIWFDQWKNAETCYQEISQFLTNGFYPPSKTDL
jgi:hypothetical protein